MNKEGEGTKGNRGKARGGVERIAKRVSVLGREILGEPVKERTRKFKGEVKSGARKVGSDLEEVASNLGRTRKSVRKAGSDIKNALSRAISTMTGKGTGPKDGDRRQRAGREEARAGKEPFREKGGRAAKAKAKAGGTTRKGMGDGKAARKARAEPFSSRDGKEKDLPFSEQGGTRVSGGIGASRGSAMARRREGSRAISGNGVQKLARPKPESIPATKPPPAKKKGPAAKASGRLNLPGSMGLDPTRGNMPT